MGSLMELIEETKELCEDHEVCFFLVFIVGVCCFGVVGENHIQLIFVLKCKGGKIWVR